MTEMYKQAGVNLDEAHNLNKMLDEKLSITSFAGACNIPMMQGYKLVTCCDGIGSKIIPLYEHKMYKTIAIDVVAANLNDLVCSGAQAVAFSDYIAVNKLDSFAISEIVQEMSKALKDCNCSLLGGETSEIPELISSKNIDISGFAIGFVKQGEELLKQNVKAGDVVIGLCSSGVHANGFSLIRKLHKEEKISDNEFKTCLNPTYIYYNKVLELVNNKKIKTCANITGGGVVSNLSRVIPQHLKAKLDFDSIPKQGIFEKLKELCDDEFYEVFNAGVGFCLVVDAQAVDYVTQKCAEFNPFVFGKIIDLQ